jgi:hypothetical protein
MVHLLGHASATITLSVSSRWFRDMKPDAVAAWTKLDHRPANQRDP